MRRHPFKSATFWVAACLVWSVLVVWLSLMDHPPRLGGRFLGWDKLHHAVAYALLTVLAGNSWRYLGGGWWSGWMGSSVFALGFGIVMELLQYAKGSVRLADPLDVLANGVGIATVLLTVMIFRRSAGKTGADDDPR